MKERDQAKEELERWKSEATTPGVRPEFQFRALPNDVKEHLNEKFQALTAYRKERVVSPTLAGINDIVQYKAAGSFPFHKASMPGVICVDIHPKKSNLIVTGGLDKNAIVFDLGTNKKLFTLSGHEKQVNCAIFHPDDIVFTTSDDTTVRVWNPVKEGQQSYECSKVFTEHKAPVIECCLHPTNSYLLSISTDSSWGFYDFDKGSLLTQVMDPDRSPFTCTMLHPDGYIFATGTVNKLIRIWDIRSQKNVATFQGHQEQLNDVQFSENGIYLASCSQDNSVKVWDLRGPTNITTLNLDVTPMSMHYDFSGVYLAVAAGREVRIFIETRDNNVRNLQHIKNLDDHTDTVTGVRFGPDAKFLVSTSMDKTVKLWRKE